MKAIQIKLLVIALFILPLLALAVFKTNPVRANSSIREDVAQTYNTKCKACHGPTALKFFDTVKPVEEHVAIILDGKKGDKPPFMPAYKDKEWMSPEVATALVEHMMELASAATPSP